MTLREIVEAGAGCGKTTGLVDRYVAALGLHTNSELKARYAPQTRRLPHAREILALTFTNEAARQMQERILKRLHNDGFVLEARAVREESQISTYHSFCLRLLQPYLVKRGFEGPLLSPALANYMRREYLLKALSEYPEATQVRRVMSLQNILSEGARLWFHPLEQSPVDEMRATYKKLEDRFNSLRSELYIDAESATLAIAAREKKPNPDAWAFAVLEALKEPSRENFAKIHFGRGPRWVKQEFSDLHEKAENLRVFFGEGYGAFLDHTIRSEELVAQDALWSFLKWALPTKPKIFDFEAAEQELLTLLKENTSTRIVPPPRVILVDEFQDTNSVQYEILQQISDDLTEWYFVGDPKQSIYAFRGGDVSLFYRLRGELEHKGLDTNYRSHTNILKLVNHLQPTIFHPTENPHDPETQILKWPEGKTSGEVTMHWLESANDSTLNYAIDLLLRNRRHFEESSCAVLFRSWSKLYAFAEQLRKLGVAFRIAGSENPFDHLLTDLFCSYLLSQDNSENVEGFWGLERWKDSKNFDWNTLAAAPDLGEAHRISERSLSAVFQRFCESIQPERFENSQTWVAAMERWIQKSVAEGLCSRMTRSQLASWILANRDQLESENPYRITPDDASQAGLTLLTLHGSKGLEFRHVYLPELFERLPQQREESIEGEDGDVMLKINLKKQGGLKNRSLAFELRKADQARAQFAEQKRLLYVAITRAIETLHIVGHRASEPKHKPDPLRVVGSTKPVPLFWHRSLQELNSASFAHTLSIETEAPSEDDPGETPRGWAYPRDSAKAKTERTVFHRCGVSRYLKVAAENLDPELKPIGKEKHRASSFDFAPQNDVGTEFHSLLELWNGDSEQLDTLLQAYDERLQASLRAAASGLRALPELADYWLALNKNPERVQREFGVFLISPEYRLSGFADAVYFKSRDELCLIDWKSGASMKRLTSTERIEKFREQLHLYASGFAASFRKIRIEVYGIEFGNTPQVARVLSEDYVS